MTPSMQFEQFQQPFQQPQVNLPDAEERGVSVNLTTPQRAHSAYDNPHSVRWLYGAGLYKTDVKSRTTGMQKAMLPQGALVPFQDFPLQVDNPNLDDDERTIYEEVTAFDAITNALSETSGLGGIVIEALTGVDATPENVAMLRTLFAIIHPAFETVGHVCPEATALEPRPICPTCRIAFLSDEFVRAQINTFAEDAGLNPELCFSVAAALKRANETLLRHFRNTWNDITGELRDSKVGKEGLRRLFPEHHYIRKCLHETSPENEQAEVAAGYGSQVALAMQETSKQQSAVMATVIKEVAASGNDRIASVLETMAEQNKMIMQLVLAGQQPTAPPADSVISQSQPAASESPIETINQEAPKPATNQPPPPRRR